MSTPKRNSIICNEDSNEYFVNYNEVKVLKNGLNFTSLKVKVFPFFSTSLKMKVLKLLLNYSNALLLLRYCTTLLTGLCASVSTSCTISLKDDIYTDTEEGRSLVILCLRAIKCRHRPYSFPG